MSHAAALRLLSRASWIWPESQFWNLHNGYALFRKAFEVSRPPRKALLHLTADQSYQLYVNGHYVCRGPARGYQGHWPYDTIDIGPHLVSGRNVVAVRAHNPGCGNFQYLSQGFAGFLAAGRIGSTLLVTDGSWKARRQTGVVRGTVPCSVQLFSQEHIDLRVENPTWMTPGFDDSSWTARPAASRWDAMPWPELEERGIPMLEEEPLLPRTCLGTAHGASAPGYREALDVAALLFTEGEAHEPETAPAEEIVIPASGAGQWRRVLIDFGRTVVGSLGVGVQGARGGEIIDTFHGETIDSRTLAIDHVPDPGSRTAFGQRMICAAGESEHVFYHAQGFRYLLLVVRDSDGPLTLRPFLRTAFYPLRIEGTFRSSDPDLVKIWDACAWTQRVCSLDAFVDTPGREQAQWWGDARVQAWNTFHLAADPRLLRRGIASLAGQRTPNGLPYGHAPTIAHTCILPDFSLIWILTLWDHYWQTGSTEVFQTHLDAAEGILRYFKEWTDAKTGLVGYDSRYWLFLDWTDIRREGYPALLSLWYLLALEKLATLGTLALQPRRAAAWRKEALRLRGALRRLIGKDGLMRDGYDAHRRIVPEASVHAQTLALLTGLRPESEAAMLEKRLLPFLREEEAFQARPSAYWTTYIFSVLRERGHGGEIVRHIRKHWLPMAEHGTTWENFAPRRGDESFSHAWSAHPLFHLMQIVGGIVQTARGWSQIAFRPTFHGDFNRTVVPTPKGPIVGEWERHGGKIDVRLKLPAGVKATVFLPGEKRVAITGNRRWKIAA